MTKICLTLLALASINTIASATVIRADMQPNAPFSAGPPVNFTGVDTNAAAANSVFGSNGSNTWNYLTVNVSNGGTNPTTPSVNPSFSGLLNSAGTATSVGLSFTGNLVGADDHPIDSNGSDGLENDYFFIDANSSSASVSYMFTGLPHSTPVTMFLYAPNFTDKGDRGYALTANGTTINVASGSPNDALATITTDASGDISGTWSTSGNEGDWSGFQLSFVPEPASLSLFFLGGVALLTRRRHRCR